MKIYRISGSNIFRNEHIDSYSGQSNFRLTAEIDGEIVGWIDYVIFGDEISVSNIEVIPLKRRQGIGTRLIRYLQKMYPNQEIDMGMFTNDGIALYNSLDKSVTKNEDYIRLVREMESLKAESDMLTEELDHTKPKNQRTDEESKQVDIIVNRFNEIRDRLYDIEKEIQYMKPSTTIIN